MKAEKRKVRGYKITDTDYNRAMKMAAKDKIKLAPMIEDIIIRYGKNKMSVKYLDDKDFLQIVLDKRK